MRAHAIINWECPVFRISTTSKRGRALAEELARNNRMCEGIFILQPVRREGAVTRFELVLYSLPVRRSELLKHTQPGDVVNRFQTPRPGTITIRFGEE